jgi:multicomponent Na+:H+ antiporter subunit B
MYAFSYRDADTVHYAGRDYLASGTSDTGAANLVSAIYLNYRLFDTLFEILVFSVAVLGVRFYLVGREEEESVDSIPESGIVRTSADLLFPLILLIGIYLTLLGHLSPGGGFSGGVVAGSGLLLCAVAVGADVVGQRFHETLLERLEWGVLLVILLVGLLPLLFHRLPLVDLLPRGKVGRLISGGAIPLYNILIGGKVFIGTWVIIHYFLRHRGEI